MWGQPPPAVPWSEVRLCLIEARFRRSSTSFKLSTNRFVTPETNLSKLKVSVEAPLILLCLIFASCIPALSQSISAIGSPHGAPHDPQTDAAFENFYNMDYDPATQDFERIVEKRPNDPFAANLLLTAVLMHDLYDTGAMNTGDYA